MNLRSSVDKWSGALCFTPKTAFVLSGRDGALRSNAARRPRSVVGTGVSKGERHSRSGRGRASDIASDMGRSCEWRCGFVMSHSLHAYTPCPSKPDASCMIYCNPIDPLLNPIDPLTVSPQCNECTCLDTKSENWAVQNDMIQ